VITRFFPSQIVEYIDRKFPHAKTGKRVNIPVGYMPTLSVLITMLDGIPPYVINLDEKDFIDYIETIEAIKATLNAWKNGIYNFGFRGAPGLDKCPIAVIREKLLMLRDEGVSPGTTKLMFIDDESYRELLKVDITVMNNAFDNGEWKAATILAGSIIEALLLYKIKIIDVNDKPKLQYIIRQNKNDNPNLDFPNDLDRFRLNHLIPVAVGLNIIEKDPTGIQCEIARGFRNLIHPGQAIRAAQVCDRGTALSSLAAVEHVIRNLS
jgi:hypothetical protein